MPKITKKTEEVQDNTRPVIYAEPQVQLCTGDEVMTVDAAKSLLGWEEEADDVKFGSDFLLVDVFGKKVRCVNNTKNRPLTEKWAYTIAQEHLQLRWRLNGETIVIGTTGEVLSGQHRLIALILAEQLRQKHEHWQTNWPDEITMNCVVVFGIDEQDEVVNTLDTGKSRTLGDVLYRSELLAKYEPKVRRAMARACDYATRLYWHRTGASNDAFAPTKTHSEAMNFLTVHPKFLEVVNHIVEEDEKGAVAKFVSPGTAAGLCYLMAACASDPDQYDKTEDTLDLTNIDKARDFFVMLAGGASEVGELCKAILSLSDPDSGTSGSLSERIALIVKAWNQFVEHGKVTAAQIRLEYATDTDGIKRLNECPAVGGIDLGDPTTSEEDEDVEETEPTEEEIEQRKVTVKEESLAKKKDEAKADDDELESIRVAHPKHVIWFEGSKGYLLVGQDADLAVKVIGSKLSAQVDGKNAVRFPKSSYVPAMTALNEAGYEVAIARKDESGITKVERIKPIAKKKGKK